MVEKLGNFAYRSSFLPGNIFESREAAEFYDRQEEMKLNAAAQDADEELLSKLSPQALKNLTSAFLGYAAMNTQETADFMTVEFNKFTSQNPKYVVSEENSRRLASFLYGAGLHPPFSAQNYQDAYDVLSVQGQIDLYKIEVNQQGRRFVETGDGRRYLDPQPEGEWR